jgi:glycosyltransferase involved in cell wall biosynthesis
MSITHVTCQHGISGIGRYGFELTQTLYQKGITDYWYKPFKKNHADTYLHAFPWVRGYSYKSFRDLHARLLPFYIQFGLKEHGDFAHAHWFLSGLGILKKRFKGRIITMHDVSLLHESEQTGWYEQYYAKAIETFKKQEIPIICVSNQAKADAILYANYPEELIHVVPNGIDHNQFNAQGREHFYRNQFRIIYSGGLGKRKNLGLLLQAVQQVQQRGYDCELVVAGAYPERTAYPKMAQELGLKNVRFTGFLPESDMLSFYQNADLFVYPSLYEGFGFAPLEAMACGTPVLTAKGGALNEISAPGAQVFEYDIDDLAYQIQHMIEHEQMRNSLSKKGLAWVRKYSWEATTKRTQHIYVQLGMA